MKPTKRSTMAMAGIVALYILCGFVEGHAMSLRGQLDYGPYPMWVREQCKDQNRYRGRVDYNRALQCAKNTMRVLEQQKNQEHINDLLKSQTELNRELTKNIKRR